MKKIYTFIYLDRVSEQTIQDFQIPKMSFLAKFDQRENNPKSLINPHLPN